MPQINKRLKKKSSRHVRPQILSTTHKPDHLTTIEWQHGLRVQSARTEKLQVHPRDNNSVYGDYSVTNATTQKEYRIAIRGKTPGINYCSCPDYAVNTLGACKHIEAVLLRLNRNPQTRKALNDPCQPPAAEIYLRYGAKREVVFSVGASTINTLVAIVCQYFDRQNVLTEKGVLSFDLFLKKARNIDPDLICYDDALNYIAEWRDALHRAEIIDKEYNGRSGKANINLPFVKVPLYPYQYEGAVFAARAGRSIIADEMGLGKTIQAIAATEILARHFGVAKVLIVCPTSLKYQWQQEIGKFCSRDASIIEGNSPARRLKYAQAQFYTIANYEQIYRDLPWIAAQSWDLIILDETQRIKNWKTRTSQAVKSLQSTFAIALTGTPLENRLEELHSIISFIDRYKLGPLFKFLENHQIADPVTGKVTGYRNLTSIGSTLSSILIRRTKKQVLPQLPGRLDKNFFVDMTQEQMAIHQDNANLVAQVVARWKKFKHLSESDQRKLMTGLQNMRMSCDSTYLFNPNEHYGPKLEELMTLLGELFTAENEKVVIFSQWKRMHQLIAQTLDEKKIGYVFLHGGVAAKKRGCLVSDFKTDPKIRVFLSTDAGGTGLNLQNAATVINIDLPWNPAVLEQRIGRIHRLGQHRPVRVINFISSGTIEHGMLNILAFKRSLFAGVLDGGADSVYMGESRLTRFMKDVQSVTQEIPAVAIEEPLSPDTNASIENPVFEGTTGADSTIETNPAIDQMAQQALMQNLLTQGAVLLQGLAQVLTKSQSPAGATTIIEHDQATGKNYLKLALPEPAVIMSILEKLALMITAKP